ncbi:MAG: glycosyltransferase family 4 protein [Roseivirga sp.]|nr:glycosyltransferase family 4 protein [Roseivirga sp.]
MIKPGIIYLGNQLSVHGVNPTSVETLGQRLKEDFTVIRASSKANKWLRLLDMWRTLISNKEADFVLIDTYSTSAFIFAWTCAFLARKLGLKYIPILHGGALPNLARSSPKRLTIYLKGAYKVVCPSPYLREKLIRAIDMEYKVVPNAIDLADYSFTARTGLDQSGPQILWVRAFDKIYNPQLAVKLLKGLVDMGYVQASLCMVGPDKDGSLADVRKLAKELQVEDRVRFTGSLTKTEWIELSKAYDVFINTTNVDNTPVSVIESLALGLPVISTRVGGIPYILESGKNAILVEADNVETFIKAIESLYDSALYSDLAANGRVTAEGYSWEQIRHQWLNILK